MGHAQITTTQKYLHSLPDADTKNLTALDRIRNSFLASPPEHRRLRKPSEPSPGCQAASVHRHVVPARLCWTL